MLLLGDAVAGREAVQPGVHSARLAVRSGEERDGRGGRRNKKRERRARHGERFSNASCSLQSITLQMRRGQSQSADARRPEVERGYAEQRVQCERVGPQTQVQGELFGREAFALKARPVRAGARTRRR